MLNKKNKNGDKNREQDRFTVVLEAIQSDFQVFGEKLDFIDGRLNGIDGRLDRIELRLDKIELVLSDIKKEIADLKTKLDKKADLDRLEKLEKKVKQIEIILTRVAHK